MQLTNEECEHCQCQSKAPILDHDGKMYVVQHSSGLSLAQAVHNAGNSLHNWSLYTTQK
jgi:hypothetical protein